MRKLIILWRIWLVWRKHPTRNLGQLILSAEYLWNSTELYYLTDKTLVNAIEDHWKNK
jgi:hypothetical protein